MKKTFKKSSRKLGLRKTALFLVGKSISVAPVGLNKKPKIKWKKLQSQTPTIEEVKSWWPKPPYPNIGIITGRINNLTVIDCDSDHFIKKVESFLEDPRSVPTENTPRGGRHYYFSYNPELRSSNRQGLDLHIKSEGGLVLCAPSQTENGFYSWNPGFGPDSLLNPPPIPEGLVQFLKTEILGSPSTRPSKAPPFMKGRRDNDIFHVSYVLLRDGVAREDVERIALQMAKVCNPPFSERAALRKVQSAYDRTTRQANYSSASFSAVKKRFSESRPQQVKYVMQDRIPMGMLTVFIGNPGDGKTFLGIEIACRVSKGEPLPGASKALVSGSTIFVSAENPLDYVLAPRAIACRGDLRKLIHIPAVMDKLGEIQIFDVTKHIPVLEEELKKNPDVKQIIVDPIVSHLGNKIDTRDQLQVRRAMDALSNFAEKYGVAVIAIMHLNKSQIPNIVYRASGSIQFIAAAKAAWWIVKDPRDPDGARRLFLPVKTNLSPDRSGLAFRIEPELITYERKKISTGKVVFEDGVVEVNAADIIAPENLQNNSLVGQAMRFVKDFLGEGPKSTVELEARGEELGFSKSLLKKARMKLDVRCVKEGMRGGWTCLPPQQGKNTRAF